MTTTSMNKDALTTVLAGAKEGVNKIKKSKRFESIVEKAGVALGKAYRATEAFIKGHWKNAALATATTVGAGAITTGLGSALCAGALLYGGIKTLAYYLSHKQVRFKDATINLFIESSIGFVYGMGLLLAYLIGGTLLITLSAELGHFLAANWMYVLYLLVG
ncbi:hypothetical protein [Virgibacillus salexigens]|uniref:Uncharacterized protein n=1 Tax=Virgibacillus massiliensis TaxID=1462526 RepID=A0A024QHX5_9BACI|nr:hypothetical protein [Virgibacillus massiliensis]CDQ41847.1 hypothetical protein BN990_04226 [Virgibacillus massiliensis]